MLGACASNPKHRLGYSYVESITTARHVSFRSNQPLDCMAVALQREAGNQPSPGVYAVGVTIMTRAKGRVDRICKVTRARRQFEGVRRHGSVAVSIKTLGIAKRILQTKETGWTHFWAPKAQARLKRGKPLWATRYEQRQCQSKTIADHVFFNKNQCKKSRGRGLASQNN